MAIVTINKRKKSSSPKKKKSTSTYKKAKKPKTKAGTNKKTKYVGSSNFNFFKTLIEEHFTTHIASMVECDKGFNDYAEIEAKNNCALLRHLVSQICKGNSYDKVKLCLKYKVDARVFNFVENFASAMVSSAKECLELDRREKNAKLDKAIEHYQEAMEDETRAQLGRRKHYIEKLERQIKHIKLKPSIFVFAKDEFKIQDEYHIQHKDKEWKELYRLQRDALFGSRGSKDEIGGNSTYRIEFECTQPSWIMVLGCVEWYNRYKFKVTHAGKVLGHFYLNEKEGIELMDILSKNNQEFEYTKRRKAGNKHRSKITTGRTGLRIYFMRKGNGWNIYISYPMLNEYRPTEHMRRQVKGVIGIDYNHGHIECTALTIKEGKLEIQGYKKIAYDINATTGQRDNKLFKAIREIVTWAKKLGYTVILEHLDFEPSKMVIGKGGLRKVLHAMPYKKVRAKFERECYKHGVGIRYVNPRHTSNLGNLIATDYPWFSRDVAASVVIGLRGFSEGNKFLTDLCIKYRKLKKVRINYKGKFGQQVGVERSAGDNELKIDSSSSRSIIQTAVGDSITNIGKTVSKFYSKYRLKKRTNSKRPLTCQVTSNDCVVVEDSRYTLSGLPKSTCQITRPKKSRTSPHKKTEKCKCSTLHT